ncbi:hypothetical protein HPP92_023577 [Vanilla planifolia]|uniref:Uncharacterized protein n=1 Tax=Vanilla planifolia TaxID=51239 RepID=A0A835UAK8_VANPL|nr:hypothetical protein HPP92_023844 [Vanilla planifolia]KAG0455789.1 hypothetical protein HPP92_023577 [Vanilla planifolia]
MTKGRNGGSGSGSSWIQGGVTLVERGREGQAVRKRHGYEVIPSLLRSTSEAV